MNNKGIHHQGYNDNSWSGQNVRKSYDYNNQNNNRGDYQHDGGKIEQRLQSLRLDGGSSGNKSSNADQHSKEPKKMTWATIASQPAKPQISTTSTTIKKKGPGMPPPPMVPGKHNMELIDGWDAPKNVPLVPSPPVITAPAVDLSEKQSNSNFDEQPAWPTPGQAVTQGQQQQNTQSVTNHSQPPPVTHHQQSQQHQQQQQQQHNNNYQRERYMNSNNNNNQNHSNYHGRQQYNQNSGSHNSSNYNDYQKPYHQHPQHMPSASSQHQSAPITRSLPPPPPPQQPASDFNKQPESNDSILEKLRIKNQYNPSELDLSLVDKARFFVIKSYSEDDIHRSIKYEIWCSTEHGNKRLDQAFREREKENGVIYLLFSVNSSGHFCGVAQMITPVDYSSNSSVWSQDKWKGSFRVKWVYVKDVPNTQLRHIRLENNENKPVTNSRDTQEVPNGHGIQILKIIHNFKHTTSIFDDFIHYEKRQEEEDSRRTDFPDGGYQKPLTVPPSHNSTHNRENANRQAQFDRGDRGDRDYSNGNGGFDRGNFNNGNFNKYGSNYNNDFKPFNGRGGFNKRNDFRNDRNGGEPNNFYRAKDYQQNDDFGNRGYRSDSRGGSRGGRGGFRPMNHNN